ncbi:hypothetical protein RDWZM_007633 [Blomia tropicalis]|uniref:Uncharacterized protein n=1 Tax=Blomia tropicalis TaxID=40697 RepID=A0A9Q0RKM1_BLOTA|nr:hypothetical protein RDWZM_007633 [Blomia tropicalis]
MLDEVVENNLCQDNISTFGDHLFSSSSSKSKQPLIVSHSDGSLRTRLYDSEHHKNTNDNKSFTAEIVNSISDSGLSKYSEQFSGDNQLYSQQSITYNGDSQFDPLDGTNLSDSLSSLYLPQFSRQLGSTIMSGLNWINQIEFGSILQNIVQNTNIFRRRNSSTLKNVANQSSTTNDGQTSSTTSNTLSYSSNTFQTKALARLLNSSNVKTLKPSELIELDSFGLVELDNVEPGIGHEFQRYENDKPTWCDACAEYLSTPVMNDDTAATISNISSTMTTTTSTPSKNNNNTNSIGTSPKGINNVMSNGLGTSTPVSVQADHLMRTYLQCRKCNYVCHLKCHNLIRIDCQPSLSAVSPHSPPKNHLRSNMKPKRNNRHRNSVRFDSESVRSIISSTSTDTITELPLDSNNNSDDIGGVDDNNSSQENSQSDTNENDDSTLMTSSFTTDLNSDLTFDQTETLIADDEMGNSLSLNDSVFTETKYDHEITNGNHQTIESNSYDNNEHEPQPSSSNNQNIQSNHTLPELLTPSDIVNLKQKILKYNNRIRSKGSGLGITLIDETKQLFRGFLRVHMNLTRPINVIAGKRPPSIYDIINEEEKQQQQPNNNQRKTLTSFYMPRDTVKNIHITSESTSLQVIKAMLKKFKVVDNPQKFALYLRRRFPDEELQKMQDDEESSTSSTSTNNDEHRRFEEAISQFLTPSNYGHSLKRLNDQERPLILQLEFDSFLYGSVDIVLQENDNADIAWDAFEVPELKNFLKILDREENEHLEHVQTHYHELKRVIQVLIEYEESKRRMVDIVHPKSDDIDGNQPDKNADDNTESKNSVVMVNS